MFHPSFYTLSPIIGVCLIIWFSSKNELITKILSTKLFVGIGLISYSLYLWHYPIFAFARINEFIQGGLFNKLLLGIIILLVSIFSYYFVERPLRNKQLNFKKILTLILIVILTISLINSYVILKKGKIGNFYKLFNNIYFHNNILNMELRDESWKYVNNYNLQKFQSKEKIKILIIGDSHSEDLVNAVFEAGLNSDMEFSSYYISTACGVLFVRDKKDREETNLNCQNKGYSFFNNDLQTQMSLADEIWIISSWKQKDIIYMAKSIENIKTINKNIKLFGTKNFGSPSSNWYNFTNIDDWSSAVFNEDDITKYVTITKVNDALSNTAESFDVEFFNTQHLICRGEDFCSNYIDGNIISYDGSHLTKYGAGILGASLKNVLNKNNKVKIESERTN